AADSTKQIIKGVKSIHTGCYTQTHNTTNFRNYASAKVFDGAAESSMGAEPQTSITPGKVKIRATVNAEFYVK
ncbi:MAG: hypothetical protein ACI37T_07790, partial [Candidatus Gastranaerophilaceae bacterium]